MSERKKRLWQAMVCIGLVIVVWGGFFLLNSQLLKKNDLSHLTHDYFNCVYQIDSVEDDGENISLTGWAFKLNTNSKDKNMDVYLYDLSEEKIVYADVDFFDREDVNQYFLCEYDYTHSGFKATFDSKKLDMLNKDYEVLVEDRLEKNIFKTGIFLSKGEIVYANPKEFRPVKAEGTELEQIVKEGKLRVYRPEVGIYVYQYEGKLYWIASEDYYFEEDASTYVQLHLFTTQKENLPKYRLDMGYEWDNAGFVFEEKEIVELNTGKYRVTVADIPDEYSVVEIKTGYYAEEWIWSQRFRPYYDFSALN